ncbi:MAG TPA: hypothetical protein VFN43_04830 [Humibacillus sp.]|jgi:hypothetical protein|nr:hypothetical protein [Humibacillus sp.]
MTTLDPDERAVVASVVGEDVMAQDQEALAAARSNYRRTVTLLQRHPWRAEAPPTTTTGQPTGSRP